MKQELEMSKLQLWNLLPWSKRVELMKERAIKGSGSREVVDNRIVRDGVLQGDLEGVDNEEVIEKVTVKELLGLIGLKSSKIVEITSEGEEKELESVSVKSDDVKQAALKRDGKDVKLKGKKNVKKIKTEDKTKDRASSTK